VGRVVGGAGDGCCVFYGDSCVGRRCGWLVGYARARGGRGEEVAGLIMEGDGCGLGVDGEGGRGKGGGEVCVDGGSSGWCDLLFGCFEGVGRCWKRGKGIGCLERWGLVRGRVRGAQGSEFDGIPVW